MTEDVNELPTDLLKVLKGVRTNAQRKHDTDIQADQLRAKTVLDEAMQAVNVHNREVIARERKMLCLVQTQKDTISQLRESQNHVDAVIKENNKLKGDIQNRIKKKRQVENEMAEKTLKFKRDVYALQQKLTVNVDAHNLEMAKLDGQNWMLNSHISELQTKIKFLETDKVQSEQNTTNFYKQKIAQLEYALKQHELNESQLMNQIAENQGKISRLQADNNRLRCNSYTYQAAQENPTVRNRENRDPASHGPKASDPGTRHSTTCASKPAKNVPENAGKRNSFFNNGQKIPLPERFLMQQQTQGEVEEVQEVREDSRSHVDQTQVPVPAPSVSSPDLTGVIDVKKEVQPSGAEVAPVEAQKPKKRRLFSHKQDGSLEFEQI